MIVLCVRPYVIYILSQDSCASKGQYYPVETEDIPLPKSAKEHYLNVTLCAMCRCDACELKYIINKGIKKDHIGAVYSLHSMDIPVLENAMEKISGSYVV